MAVWITGTGCITCVGRGRDRLWNHAFEEKSGIDGGLGRIDDARGPLEFCRIAIQEALEDAGWDKLGEKDGLILATTTGQILAWDQPMLRFLRGELGAREFEQALKHQPLGDLLETLAQELGTPGPRTLVTSACAAGTQALGLAAMWLNSGKVGRCLVGGVEVLCDLTVQGFRSLQLLNPETTRPFDAERKGINLSEGAAFLCLERGGEKNSRALARVSGYGMTSDGYHMTAPHPEGRGSFEAMRAALKIANIKPAAIDWVHAHGTGSPHNDASEGAAIKALFGSGDKAPWVSSSKHIHGHALGAAGCIESVLCVEALQRQTVLRTSGLRAADPALALRHPREHFSAPIRHIMKNTLGFGGTNAAVIFSREDVP